MKKVIILAAVVEIAIGSALFVTPSLVVRLLFDTELVGIATVLARIGGIALIGFGVACWPCTPATGLLIYNATVAIYLACIGIDSSFTGIALWPAVFLHAVFAILIMWPRRPLEKFKS